MKVPPAPRGSQYALGFFNLVIFIFAVTMISAGAVSLAGYASIFSDDLRKLAATLSEYIPPEMAQGLTTAINYAPTLLIVVGTFLALISFAGCCGAFCRSRALLCGYTVVVVGVLLVQLSVMLYTYHQGGSIQSAAGDVATSLWDKRCLCVDGPSCLPSPTECMHPETPVPCPPGINPASCIVKCQPCKDYFEATVCSTPELSTGPACAAHIQALLSAHIQTVVYLIAIVLTVEMFCLGAARRVWRWLREREEAERAEEALLAETYRLHKGVPYPGGA